MHILIRVCTVLLFGQLFLTAPVARAESIESHHCRAVENLATLKRPSSLVVGVGEDHSKKKCEFAVSLPPPGGLNADVDAWFKAKTPSDLTDPKVIGAVLRGLALSISESRAAEVAKIIGENSGFLSDCVTHLLKKNPTSLKSKDGRIQCNVPKDADHLEFRISAGVGYTMQFFLPRTV